MQKTLHSSKSNGLHSLHCQMARDRGSKQQNKRSNLRLTRSSARRKNRKNESNYYQKLLEIEKEIVREVAFGGWTPPEKICRSKSTNQEGVRSAHRTDLCFSICRFSQVVFIPQAQPHAQSLFLFPIVFGINLVLDEAWNNLFVPFTPRSNLKSIRPFFLANRYSDFVHCHAAHDVELPKLFSGQQEVE